MDLSLPLHGALWESFLLDFFSFFLQIKYHRPTCSQFSPNKCSDFHFASWNLTVSIRWSKVLQLCEQKLLIPLVSIPSHHSRPVQAFCQFFDMCLAPASSPAFVISTATGLHSLSFSSFAKHLKDLLRLSPWRSHVCMLTRYLP